MPSNRSENAEPKSVAEAAAGMSAVLKGGVAETVIGCALVGVLENLVGLVDLLEAHLAVFVVGIAIGVPFHRQFAKCGFQLPFTCGAIDLQNLIIAALGHAVRPIASHLSL